MGVKPRIEKDLLDHARVINRAEDPRRVLADGAAERVHVPDPEIEVSPPFQREMLSRKEAQKKGINYGRHQQQHVAQILGYLRSSGVEHGLLINFGAPKFEIKKYALSRTGAASRPGGLIGGALSVFASD
jgi:hypothetical protein